MEKNTTTEFRKALRAAGRERTLADLRDGRHQRSMRIPNKRAQASREACRKGGF